MPTKILVATPDPAFGEWLQSSLVENGHYDAYLVRTGSEVLDQAAIHSFSVAILDSDLPDEPFVPLARSLVALLPEVRLLVIPPENNPHHPNLAGLVPQGYLYRPFYLPVLLDTLQSLLAANGARANNIEPAPVEVASPAQSWLEDPAQAAHELSRLLLETNAQTALIAAEGRLWAASGQISQAAASEAAALLANCWQEGRPVDLARYLRLESGGSEHLLYAVALLDELALALLYDPSVPLTRAHREATRLARALTASTAARPLPEPSTAPPAPAAPEPEPETPLADLSAPAALSGWLPAEAEFETPGSAEVYPPEPAGEWSSADLRAALVTPQSHAEEESYEESDLPGEEIEGEEPLLDLATVLAGMPSPDPGGEPVFPASDWVPEDSETENETTDQDVEDRLDAIVSPPANPPQDGQSQDEIPAWLLGIDAPAFKPTPVETHPLQVGPPAPSEPGKTGPVRLRASRDPVPDTGAQVPLSLPGQRALPVTTGITYTCILIPEHPTHYLTGDLADRLGLWVPQLCLAFGWHLSGMVVRPGYLQWTVELLPTVSPGNVVRVVRQRTSERLFSQYASLRYGLARTDFWASGYLAVRGPHPPSAALLEGFIRQTRARQHY